MENSFSLKVSVLSSIPFLLLCLISVVTVGDLHLSFYISGLFVLIPVLLFYIMLIIGWLNDFPRWSVPSIGFCIIFSLLLMNVSVPIISGGNVLGLWALLPLVIALLISILIKPTFKPLSKILERIKEDKSLIIYLIYGILPLFVVLFFDEITNNRFIPILLGISIIISFGAFFYLYSKKIVIRILSLIFGMIVSLSISVIAII